MNKKVLIGIGIAIVLLCVVAGGALLLLAGGGFVIQQSLSDPEGVNITVDAPLQATKGNEVTVEIRVENTETEAQLLHSVDISLSYLEGIDLDEAQPSFYESYDLPLVEMKTYTFEENIPSGETLVVQFMGTAVGTGDYSGMIDVCINNGALCQTFTTRTVIKE